MEKINKYRILFIISIVLLITSIIVICILLKGNDESKVKIYAISGESDNFYYSNAMFVSSDIKNIYVYGDVVPKNHKIDVKDITNYTFKSGDRLIISSSSLPKQISVENYGYDELFPKEVVDNLDNWILEITYKNNKETTTEIIKLNNQYIMDKVKVQPIA